MPKQHVEGSSDGNSWRSKKPRAKNNSGDDTNETTRGNKRSGYRGSFRTNTTTTESSDDSATTQKSTPFQRGKGGYNTQRGTYKQRNLNNDETSYIQRPKPYKPGILKKQNSESTISNFQIVGSNDDEEYSQKPIKSIKRPPFKKPDPKDLIWERPTKTAEDKPKSTSSQEKFNKQPFKKPNPKDLIWEKQIEKEEYSHKTRNINKQPFKKPNPKDLIWERPIEKDDKNTRFTSQGTSRNMSQKQKESTRNKSASDFQIVVSNDDEDEEYSQKPIKSIKRPPFKKPDPKDLIWERPTKTAEDKPKSTSSQEKFNKQPFKKPNPKDLIWENPIENETINEPHHSTGIHKYLDDMFQSPNKFTLPQGFSGFGSYRDSRAVGMFEISTPKIVDVQIDELDEDINTKEYEEESNEPVEEEQYEDNDDNDEEDYNNFIIERKTSDDENEQNEHEEKKQQTIIQKPQPENIEKINKNIIYSKLKTIESKTKIWEKNYPTKVNSIIGTCQEKCPRQEIRNREKDNDLSLFEKTGDVVIDEHGIKIHKADPAACVKKYARSAAAVHADASLIRSPVVLKKTLEYLTTNILKRKEEYHTIYFFIRDRARSIIQDLTIQDIRDERSVDLHEIISRFHIMSHHLLADVGEDLSDPHQNLELMSKWLKSLQELYTELRCNGIDCPNEPEFTAYYILVKITSDQEVAKCLRNLPSRVSKSQEVLFALKVYNAYSTKNYVRYFELVKEASYLNACLMHNYFTQMREEAIRIMNTCFYLKVSDISKAGRYPLSKLIDILAFETERECKDFCKAYGIYIDGDDVLFKFTTFIIPEKKIKSKRSFKLIESKVVGVSYSDLVNLNFRLAPETVKTPPKQTETTKTDIEPQENTQVKPTQIQLPTQPQIPQPTKQPTIDITSKKPMLTEPTNTMPHPIIQLPIPTHTSPTHQPVNPIPFKQPSPIPVNTSKPQTAPSTNEHFYVPKPPTEQPQMSAIPKIPTEQPIYIPTIPISPIKPIGPTEDEMKKELKKKYFESLKQNATKKKQLRLTRKQHYNNAKVFVLQENIMVDENERSLYEIYKYTNKRKHITKLFQPLDLGSIIFNSAVTSKRDQFSRFFWKLMVVPGENNTILNNWIRSKLTYSYSEEYLCNFIVNGKDIDSSNKKNTLYVCARTPKDSRSWRGTSSLIFILENPNYIDIDSFLVHEKKRMQKYFSNLDQFQNLAIPLLVLFDKSNFSDMAIDEDYFKELILHTIHEEFVYFSDVVCEGIDFSSLLYCPKSAEICIVNQILENYITWLANNSSNPPLVLEYSIRDLLEESTFSYFRRLLNDINPRERNAISVKDFILTYNDVCEFFSHQIISEMERMRKVNWPAPEFEKYSDWNTDENTILQKELLGQLSLPTIDLNIYNSKQMVDNLCNTCTQYVKDLFSKRKIYNPSICSATIKYLIVEMVNGGGSATSAKIFELLLAIHLDLLFDRDPLYSILFTKTEFNKITQSVIERLGFCGNPFINSVKISALSLTIPKCETIEPFRNLKRSSNQTSQQVFQDWKKRKVVPCTDIEQCLDIHSKLLRTIREQQNVYSQLETATQYSHTYDSNEDMTMNDNLALYESPTFLLKLLQEKIQECRK